MSADEQNRERLQHLLMAELDGELSVEERAELERSLAADPGLRAERERMMRVKEVTEAMALREPPDEVWEGYWQHVYNRVERGIGWLMFSFGVAVLLIWGAWEATNALLADQEVPAVIKVAIFVGAAGGLVLLWSVFREKIFTRKRDAYSEVQR